jgi:hypothetical protein
MANLLGTAVTGIVGGLSLLVSTNLAIISLPRGLDDKVRSLPRGPTVVLLCFLRGVLQYMVPSFEEVSRPTPRRGDSFTFDVLSCQRRYC